MASLVYLYKCTVFGHFLSMSKHIEYLIAVWIWIRYKIIKQNKKLDNYHIISTLIFVSPTSLESLLFYSQKKVQHCITILMKLFFILLNIPRLVNNIECFAFRHVLKIMYRITSWMENIVHSIVSYLDIIGYTLLWYHMDYLVLASI